MCEVRQSPRSNRIHSLCNGSRWRVQTRFEPTKRGEGKRRPTHPNLMFDLELMLFATLPAGKGERFAAEPFVSPKSERGIFLLHFNSRNNAVDRDVRQYR